MTEEEHFSWADPELSRTHEGGRETEREAKRVRKGERGDERMKLQPRIITADDAV